MTPYDAVRGAAGPVGRLGSGFMFDGTTAARGAELGFHGWSFYHLGRGGVLGPVAPEVAVAAFGFFPPELMAKAWRKGVAVMSPTDAAREYAACCARFGRTAYAGFALAGRLADLLERVSDAAPITGLPVFAGWRALARATQTASSATDAPTDAAADAVSDAARLALALQVARELRGGAHLVAVAAEGVEPLQAVMSGRYGARNAEFFGWPQPWPDPELAREAMARAEARTDVMVEPAFAVLDESERSELVTLLKALEEHVRA